MVGSSRGVTAVVALAARSEEVAMVAGSLRSRSSGRPTFVSLGRGRSVLHLDFDDEAPARALVAELRGDGWAAVLRPGGGGHLAAWTAHTAPVVVSDRLWICFPWSEFDRAAAPLVAEIDPGRAFGTGAHPSTVLLAAELSGRLTGGERLLDVGCGSGVLSVAAALLGAGPVAAVDIEPAAIDATRSNAARNDLLSRIEVTWTPVAEVHGPFDVVLANVEATTLIDLAPAVGALVAPGGWLGLSGISPAQVSRVAAAYLDLEPEVVTRRDDWAALVLTRPDPAAHP